MYNYFFIQLDVVLFYNNFITSKNIEFINAYRIVESESLFNLTDIDFNFAFNLKSTWREDF